MPAGPPPAIQQRTEVSSAAMTMCGLQREFVIVRPILRLCLPLRVVGETQLGVTSETDGP
jgi:hypothetical protein